MESRAGWREMGGTGLAEANGLHQRYLLAAFKEVRVNARIGADRFKECFGLAQDAETFADIAGVIGVGRDDRIASPMVERGDVAGQRGGGYIDHQRLTDGVNVGPFGVAPRDRLDDY